MAFYILFESASGYALFERTEGEEIATALPKVQEAINDLPKLSKMVKLVAFVPFPNVETALENSASIAEGSLAPLLKTFLETHLPAVKEGKQSKYTLAVIDRKLGGAIQDGMRIKVESGEMVLELHRGIRLHLSHFLPGLTTEDLGKAQLGLAHHYSRAKVKFNVHKVDQMVMQSIALLDQVDKDLNTLAMRCREWYSWHFPELGRLVKDNMMFAKAVCIVLDKAAIAPDAQQKLEEALGDPELAKQVIEAAKTSMGQEVSKIDMVTIQAFAERVSSLAQYRKSLLDYMSARMHNCAPNLASLIGEQVGARLILHAGSLTNLAKYPASTLQILGAEKALFRALKTRGNTPKYGLIFHSTFIGKAAPKNKGRVSRYLANKCSLAARIDAFNPVSTDKFGEALRNQVEDRLKFYESGTVPRKNAEVLQAVSAAMKASPPAATDGAPEEKRKSKRKQAEPDQATPEAPAEPKEEKKSKKKKHAAEAVAASP